MKESAEWSEDQQLMLRAGKGDLGAFEEVVNRYQHLIFSFVARMVGSDFEAEDIAQEVFLRAWKSASRYEPSAKVSTWLVAIAKNLVFDNNLRKRKENRVLKSSPTCFEFRTQEDIEKREPHRILEAKELAAEVERAILSLPEKARLAIILLRYEGMSYEEVAQVLGISIGALKSVVFRSRQYLKEKLKKYLE